MFKKDNLLEDIARKEETDKSKRKHFYTKWYNFYFDSIKEKKINLLEIGVDKGFSIIMWSKYFINGTIYGADIKKEDISDEARNRSKIFIGDINNKLFLKKLCQSVSDGFDIIVDDGSHYSHDQIKSFKYLFPRLNTGGVYVIEDLFLSYNLSFQSKSRKRLTIMQFLKNLLDDVNFSGKYKWCDYNIIKEKEKTQEYVRDRRTVKDYIKVSINKYEDMVESVHFYNGICFIFKRSE